MTTPIQKPGRSKQDYATPTSFMIPLEAKFGKITWDLAASSENTKADKWIGEDQNSLTVDWHKLTGRLFLNPPFGDIDPWARKCSLEAAFGAEILLLVPAAVGSNWFARHVFEQSVVYFPSPRVTFVGCTAPYTKDLILCHYHQNYVVQPHFNLWRWDGKKI